MDGNITWTFYYPNGQTSGSCDRRQLVNWYCDPSAKTPITRAYEASSCQYEIDIRTYYACPGIEMFQNVSILNLVKYI